MASSSSSGKAAVGIEIGGTKLQAALVTADGTVLHRRVAADPDGPLGRAAAGASPTARLLPAALAAGDPVARGILAEAARHYAHALSHVVHLLDPDVIVLGGGVAEIGPPWRDAVAGQLEPFLMETMRPAPPVRLAALGQDIVPVGAALAAVRAVAAVTPAPVPRSLETR